MIFGRALPTGWTTTRLADVCREVTVGHVGPMADKYEPAGIPFLRSQNIQPFRLNLDDIKFIPPAFHAKLKKSALAPGDVAIVRTGYPGTACVVPASLKEANCADLVIVRPSQRLDPWFLAAIFNSSWGRGSVAGNLVGVAQQHFNVGAAKAMQIALPPIEEQRRIASILSAYDNLIENNTRRIAILEEMARRIYEEWFVRFRFPGHENVRMVESDLGLVPEGWEQAALSSILQVDKGLSYKGEGLTDYGVPMVNLKNVLPGGGFRRDGTKLYSGAFKERHVVRAGEIVVANTDLTQAGTVVGSPALIPDLGSETLIFSHHIYAVRLNAEWQAARIWVYWMLASQSFKGFAKGHAVGTTVLGLPREGVTNYRLAVPPDAVVQKFSAQVEPMHLLMEKLHGQIDNLRTIRDLLLPKLISGELDVSAIPEPEAAAA